MEDLCTCCDGINNVLLFQHNEIKTSFEMSIHVVGHTFNVILYKHLIGKQIHFEHIAEEFDWVKHVSFDSELCGCTLR